MRHKNYENNKFQTVSKKAAKLLLKYQDCNITPVEILSKLEDRMSIYNRKIEKYIIVKEEIIIKESIKTQEIHCYLELATQIKNSIKHNLIV